LRFVSRRDTFPSGDTDGYPELQGQARGAIFNRVDPGKGFPANLIRAAALKLRMLKDASVLNDLRFPPGNRLEALSGSRQGQHSIRVNDQFRLVFVWTDAGPADVEFVDYH
jgi:proteic killer suppression protein